MLTVTHQQPVSLVPAGRIDEPISGGHMLQPLQGAASVASLKESFAKAGSGGRPELRPALNLGPRDKVGERADVGRALDLSKLLADLLSMILMLELSDSKMIRNSSFRETALARSQAETLIKSGETALTGGISKATAVGLATFAGVGLSLRGVGRHIKSTRTNLRRNDEMTAHIRGPGKAVHPDVHGRLGNETAKQNAFHEIASLKSARLQAQGSGVQQLASMSSSVIDGGSASVTSALNAKRETASGDASVQSRQTDVEIKSRARNENIREQTLANIKNIIQADLDVMSHVAQNTRA